MTDRVLVGADAKITGPVFTDLDEVATDTTGAPVVACVSRVTGLTLTAPSVTTETAAGAYTCALTPTHTADVDILDLTWTGTVSGKTVRFTQEVEVVGGFYASIPELRTITAIASATTYPTARLRFFRNEIERIIDTHRGTAYVPRVAIETLEPRHGEVVLTHRHATRILAVTVDDVAGTVADYEIEDNRLRLVSEAWITSDARVRVAYVHGHPSPPAPLVEAVREYVRAKALAEKSDQQRTVISYTNLATGEQFRYSTPDPSAGRYTGIESVDARINQVDDERIFVA